MHVRKTPANIHQRVAGFIPAVLNYRAAQKAA
jgi:hypothetical protein